jgi:hypothetical protein
MHRSFDCHTRYTRRKPHSPARHRSVISSLKLPSLTRNSPKSLKQDRSYDKSSSKLKALPVRRAPSTVGRKRRSQSTSSGKLTSPNNPPHADAAARLPFKVSHSIASIESLALSNSIELLESALSYARDDKHRLLRVKLRPVEQSGLSELVFHSVKFNQRIDLEMLMHQDPRLVFSTDVVKPT